MRLMLLVTAVLLNQITMASENYMYFLVSSMNMTKENSESPLLGSAIANHIYVNMQGNEFEIQTQNDDYFTAHAILEPDRFTFIKEGMKFSTELEDTNPLYSIDMLKAENAEIELSSSVIDIKGDEFNVYLGPVDFAVNNINMKCQVEKFTTSIDEACIKDTLIKPFNDEEIGSITLSDLSKAKEYKLDIQTNLLSIKDDELFIEVNTINGEYLKNFFGISRGQLSCYKDPNLNSIDVENLVYGCLKRSKIIGEKLKYKIPSLNAHINTASLSFDDNSMKLNADYASFKTGELVTYVSGMALTCDKDPVVSDINNPNAILNGCMRNTSFRLDKMDNGSQLDKKMSDIKDFKLKVTNGNFKLTGKVKLLMHISLDIKGRVTHDKKSKRIIIDVDKAKVGKISARKFALSIVKKFINVDNVKVVENSIIIQL